MKCLEFIFGKKYIKYIFIGVVYRVFYCVRYMKGDMSVGERKIFNI